MRVRNYNPLTDYLAVAFLLRETGTFGGDFDEARDSKERLDMLAAKKPGSILVAEIDTEIVGTVTLFEDGRSAWLYRFAVKKPHEQPAAEALAKVAEDTLYRLGQRQILVYAPAKDENFRKRYTKLGFNGGNNYTAYWKNLD